MGKYTTIADASNAIADILREEMVPDLILNPDHIALCSPGEKGDAVLGLYLYDVAEDEGVRMAEMTHVSTTTQRYPSTYLSLYFMITAYSNGDLKFKAAEEQRILGRVVQILKDISVLDRIQLKPTEQGGGMNIRFQMQALSTEEKYRIWNAPNSPYKLSLFYKVMPVEIESVKTREVSRVLETDFKVIE